MEKVIAVVVSYNRHALLVECIEALRSQTRKPDAILVVNNGSVDYTTVWLDKQSDIFQVYQDNMGSAGGYNTGIDWAFKNGYGWIWCMDDDGYPESDALEVLFENQGHETALLNCAVINKEDKRSFVWETKDYKFIDEVPEHVIDGICHPFNGTLIHRSIIAKVGLPKSNLFYWGEETEYFYRIVNKYKIPAKTITHSIHYHPAPVNTYRKEWEYKSSWKMYFYVRNRYQVLQSKHSKKSIALMHYLYFILAFTGSVLLYQKHDRLKKMTFTLWPMFDSFLNNFTATPESIQTRMNEIAKKSFSSLIMSPIKKSLLTLFVPSYSEGSNHATV